MHIELVDRLMLRLSQPNLELKFENDPEDPSPCFEHGDNWRPVRAPLGERADWEAWVARWFYLPCWLECGGLCMSLRSNANEEQARTSKTRVLKHRDAEATLSLEATVPIGCAVDGRDVLVSHTGQLLLQDGEGREVWGRAEDFLAACTIQSL